jgi:branched-subunit amino acid aminotransferase/4-amino-4-deoxychorismate lyase
MNPDDLRIDGEPARWEDLAHLAVSNYGAYTSLRVVRGAARGLDLHLERLQGAATELFGAPLAEERLRTLMRRATSGRADCWLRVSLFARELGPRTPDWSGPPQVLTSVSPPPPPIADSIRLVVQSYSREAAHLKHASTFGLVRARRQARASGFDDALFVGDDGCVTEGSLWNIGFWDDEQVVWPQGAQLAGVGQALLRRGLGSVELAQTVRPVRLSDLCQFSGAFICNSATPACPVTAIGDQPFPTPADLMERLDRAWASNPLQSI